MKQALQQGFSSRSRWLLQIMGLKSLRAQGRGNHTFQKIAELVPSFYEIASSLCSSQ